MADENFRDCMGLISQAAKSIIEASYAYEQSGKKRRKQIEEYIAKLSEAIQENIDKIKNATKRG